MNTRAADSRLASGDRRLGGIFLAGVARVVAIVAGDPQDPVLDGSHPVRGCFDIHRVAGSGIDRCSPPPVQLSLLDVQLAATLPPVPAPFPALEH